MKNIGLLNAGQRALHSECFCVRSFTQSSFRGEAVKPLIARKSFASSDRGKEGGMFASSQFIPKTLSGHHRRSGFSVVGRALSSKVRLRTSSLDRSMEGLRSDAGPLSGIAAPFRHTELRGPFARPYKVKGTAVSLFGFMKKPAIPPIVMAGDPVLHEPAMAVERHQIGTPELEKIIDDMVAAMRDGPGVGLAAPQIGIPLQIIVLEDTEEYLGYCDPEEVKQQERVAFPLMVILNPKLTLLEGPTATFFEGCLSVEGYRGLVTRSLNVRVEGLGRDGQPLVEDASGWKARILQHECDHVQGTIYVDKMVPRTFRTKDNLRLPLPRGCVAVGVSS